jgi:hypothetical protein
VTLFWGERVEALRDHPRVLIQDGICVVLELLDVLLAAPERVQFSLGNGAGLLQGRKLLSQLL